MSKILVVQPHRMLQQAFVVALFPEHDVQVLEKIPGDQAMSAVDLIIVDAPSLRSCNVLSNQEVRAIQDSRVPVLWIDAESPPDKPAWGQVATLAPPLTRDELRSAVADCLRLASAPETSAAPKLSQTAPTKGKSAGPKATSVAAPGGDKKVIELVDVFEEAEPRDQSRAEARNKN